MKAALGVAAVLVLAAVSSGTAHAQTPDTAQARRMLEQRFGQGVSQAELIERLRQSGMTRAQVRARLQQMGYDPGLADEYFDVIERGGEPPRGQADSDFLRALQSIGIVVQGTPGMPGDSALEAFLADSLAADSLGLDSDSLQVFGLSLFRGARSEFEPLALGPVPPDYRLGPGDQVVLILTGDVELAYTLDVTREGMVVIPDVGQISVNGLTMAQLEARLYGALGRVYSGVSRGPEATTHFSVSLGRLRTNQVFVIGETARPGSYPVSSSATVFNALYRAGGPKESGSFRHIEVRRGGEVIRRIDLYDYLLRGDSRDDVRLQHGDIVFVPIVGPQAAMTGEVRRPAIYELREGEGLRDLLNFAGGLAANAVVSRIQVDRVVPAGTRRGGIDRVLVDVPLTQLVSTNEPIPVYDGDEVTVFAVSEERRNRLILTGEVHRPGLYEYFDGMTVWDLIDRADGLADAAYTPRAHVFRLDPADGSRRLIPTPLLANADGQPVNDVLLADRDSVVVYSREELRNPRFVHIDGFVKDPDTYELAEGMTVEDLILAAGGFIPGAYTLQAEVARQRSPLERSDTTSVIYQVALGTEGFAVPAGTNGREDAVGEVPVWVPSADDFLLRHDDHVFIRRAPGYEAARRVSVIGEVFKPGTYVLETREERLTDVIRRAGGLTGEAYVPGLRLVRDSTLLATEFRRALESPQSRYNVVLEPGDSIYVPKLDPSVLVTGAVGFETRVLYEPGRDLSYYIDRAGGFTDASNEDRVTVTYPDGERSTMRGFLGVRREPDVRPGSTIFVPALPEGERGFDWDSFLSRTVTLVTLLVALQRI